MCRVGVLSDTVIVERVHTIVSSTPSCSSLLLPQHTQQTVQIRDAWAEGGGGTPPLWMYTATPTTVSLATRSHSVFHAVNVSLWDTEDYSRWRRMWQVSHCI